MNLIDTHCHLDFPDFDRDRQDVIKSAKQAGILRIINISSSTEGCKKTLDLIKKYDFIYGTIGIHPHGAKNVDDELIESLRQMAQDKKIVAIGEVGLDYYRNLSGKEEQKDAFLKFIGLSKESNLPLIIHCRDSIDDVLAILKKELSGKAKGVVHCFSGDRKAVSEVLNMGFYISFTCNLTFKNAHRLRELAKDIPIGKLLLETDAPFLAPQTFRGKRNEPAYITHLVDALSKIKNLPKEEIADITTRNANELFNLDIKLS